MGKLSKRKSRLILTTEDTYRHGRKHKPVMLELKPTFAYVWLSGSRTRFQIQYSSIYERAAWLYARNIALEVAREKAKEKALRKAEKKRVTKN